MTKNGNELPRESETSRLSRRALLTGAGIAAGAAAIVVTSVAPAEAKMSTRAAGYQATPKDGASCSSCALFKAPSSCTLVDGDISPDGWCRFYAKKS
jgi:hypothetical protein